MDANSNNSPSQYVGLPPVWTSERMSPNLNATGLGISTTTNNNNSNNNTYPNSMINNNPTSNITNPSNESSNINDNNNIPTTNTGSPFINLPLQSSTLEATRNEGTLNQPIFYNSSNLESLHSSEILERREQSELTHARVFVSNIVETRLNADLSTLELNSTDLVQLDLFESTLQTKVQEYLTAVEKRRFTISDEIEVNIKMLKKLRYSDSQQGINLLNRLHKMKIKAIETESRELQELRLKFLRIIEEYKKAMISYSTSKITNTPLSNPTPEFQKYLENLNTEQTLGPSEGYVEMLSISRKFLNNLLLESKGHNPNVMFNNVTNTINISSTVFPLSKLPIEILQMVLDRLNNKIDIFNMLSVSKLWAQLIVKIIYYRPHINKKSQLDSFMETMKLSKEQTVFDYRSMIKRLNFSFVGDYLRDDQLYNFVGCKNLERLTLVFCKHVTSESVSAVLKDCKYLQSVDITGVKEISDNIFNTLANNCPRIQGFYVPQARIVSQRALSNFISHAPILKRVKITACNDMCDDLVELMAKSCPMLVEIDITSSPEVHDESLLKLFTKLEQLREFRVTHNTNVSDKLFIDIAKNVDQLPALRLLDLSGCENITDRTVERVVALSPKLRNVFLGKCNRITDLSLSHLSRLGKNLQTVHFGHCFNITDQGVRILIQSCPRIQYVDFACCTNLTNRTLYELADLTRLKRIGLVKCSQMTDEGLLNMISLRGRHDTLERVHLSYCSNLTIYPIYELLMACPKLSHLSLTAVPSFLRPDITAFCRPAPADFSDNQRQIFCVFSGKGVQKLRHYLMTLTTPTNGPQTDIKDVLTKYIISKDLVLEGESIEDCVYRITRDLNRNSGAILAATGLAQMNGNNNFSFQDIDFTRLDTVFSWYDDRFNGDKLTTAEVDKLITSVDKKFCEDPFDEEYDDTDGTIAPGANSNLNHDLCQVVRKYHELDDRVDDFEVNVASLARVQFQFTGFLLHEMAQIHHQMLELNRHIVTIQNNTTNLGVEDDIKGVGIWRMLFTDKFLELLNKYKFSTVVLRLYLRESITVLTRQREIYLNQQRTEWGDNINAANGPNIDNNTNAESSTGEQSTSSLNGNFNENPQENDVEVNGQFNGIFPILPGVTRNTPLQIQNTPLTGPGIRTDTEGDMPTNSSEPNTATNSAGTDNNRGDGNAIDEDGDMINIED
ncbi:hypothetical protein TBLA_0I02490 [Henningerozyma blattae CBS 6284]|uniref:F-box domain-containing protein n=1 Tax=Henningerozyma blattae (strain ATCC 34711 / CBS 6284 / DSM 70876 / NBRC 10599 / NRRL Y-10934 / UCD 77-7) TaxID=1071380 RepID=I2H955_HENB6|nr:hypothetical protein TBLA_0I02490 [Tetrapisispora blattae CBS 6284]CCH62907.1 hypothetical protein TBLA_0I02490 [Tetrapisispora blattae CBS 6284]